MPGDRIVVIEIGQRALAFSRPGEEGKGLGRMGLLRLLSGHMVSPPTSALRWCQHEHLPGTTNRHDHLQYKSHVHQLIHTDT